VIAGAGGSAAHQHAAAVADGNLGVTLAAVNTEDKFRAVAMCFVRHLTCRKVGNVGAQI
jgi:hypothetical protein